MKYRLEFTLQGLPKRINQGHGSHWRARFAEARKWTHAVRLATLGLLPDEPLPTAALSFIRRSSAEPDFDGLVYSFKVIVDALRKLGVIIDDSPKVIGQPKYAWEKAKRNEGSIHIVVEEVKK